MISNWSAIRLLPNTIRTGRARGIVTIAPKTEPLFKLRELPRANKFRKMYDFNLKLLGKILKPVYFLLAFIGVKIISLIDFNHFKRQGKNLMHIKANSIL